MRNGPQFVLDGMCHKMRPMFAPTEMNVYFCLINKSKNHCSLAAHSHTTMKNNLLLRIWQSLMLCLTLFLSLSSCSSEPPSADELYKEEASGVALVLNKFYYDAQLPNGNHIYFSGIDDDGSLDNLTDEISEIRQHCGYLTGTAFFIRKDGTLLTNRHVAQPIIDEDQVKLSINAIVQYVRQLYDNRMEEMQQQYAALKEQRESCYSVDYWGDYVYDSDRAEQIDQKMQELSDEYDEMSDVRDGLATLNVQNIRIKPVCELGLAYNDSYVNDETDFLKKNPCRVVRVEQDANTDLAMIQLKNAVTPSKAHVFSVKEDGSDDTFMNRLAGLFHSKGKDDGKLKMNQQLYMIGYNAGIELANTRRGIKVQMTGGRITQLPDGDRLLYSIPTVQGSSGSPVIDEYGKLVGVNFAKLNGADNFNFGIPMEKVRRFVGVD